MPGNVSRKVDALGYGDVLQCQVSQQGSVLQVHAEGDSVGLGCRFPVCYQAGQFLVYAVCYGTSQCAESETSLCLYVQRRRNQLERAVSSVVDIRFYGHP